MKQTGDSELDFIREGGSFVLNTQARAAFWGIGVEALALCIVGGLIALLSATVATWLFTIGGGIILVQGLIVAVVQWRARKFLKKHTESTEALDAVTRGFFE